MYLKNTASQKLEVFAFDYSTGAPKTGDAANITAYINIDDAGYNALTDTSASEIDSTNKKGWYLFDLTQGETNGTKLAFAAKSSTSSVSVLPSPRVSFTQPATGLLGPTTAGRTLDVSSGGEAGVDWANVGSPTTSLDLSGTKIAGLDALGFTLAAGDFGSSAFDAIFARLRGLLIAGDGASIGSTGNDTTHVHLPTLTYADDAINNQLIVIYDASATEYHARWILDWVNSTKLATVAALPFTPQNATDAYWLTSIRQDVTGGSGLDAAGVRAAIGLASANLDTQLGAIDDYIDTEVAAIKAKTDQLTFTVANQIDANVIDWKGSTAPAMTGDAFARLGAPAGASVSADIAAVAAKTDNLPGDPADASDIAAAFSTVNSTLATIAGYIDTEVAAIKAKTDSLTFTVSGKVDSNVLYVNGNAEAAVRLDRAARAITKCTVGSSSTTTSIVTSACDPAGAAADQFKGLIVAFDKDTTTTALRGQKTDITASSNSATPTFTVTALTTAPVSGDTFTIE